MKPRPGSAGRELIRRLTVRAHPPLVPEILLQLATPACSLWSATEADLERLAIQDPFWAFCWPGGQALARFIIDKPERVAGKRVLAFGAGGGVEAIAAALAGASEVLACDTDPLAVAACGLNAELNEVSIETGVEQRLGTRLEGWDLVLAADVCYEADLARKVTAWLIEEASLGTQALLSDPTRGYFEPNGWDCLGEMDTPADADLDGRRWVPTRIFAPNPSSQAGSVASGAGF